MSNTNVFGGHDWSAPYNSTNTNTEYYNDSTELFMDVADHTEEGAMRFWLNKMMELHLPDDLMYCDSIYGRFEEIMESEDKLFKLAQMLLKQLSSTDVCDWITKCTKKQLWEENDVEDFICNLFSEVIDYMEARRMLSVVW